MIYVFSFDHAFWLAAYLPISQWENLLLTQWRETVCFPSCCFFECENHTLFSFSHTLFSFSLSKTARCSRTFGNEQINTSNVWDHWLIWPPFLGDETMLFSSSVPKSTSCSKLEAAWMNISSGKFLHMYIIQNCWPFVLIFLHNWFKPVLFLLHLSHAESLFIRISSTSCHQLLKKPPPPPPQCLYYYLMLCKVYFTPISNSYQQYKSV